MCATIAAGLGTGRAQGQSATRERGWAERLDPERERGRELLRQGMGYVLASREAARPSVLREIEQSPQVERERALVRLLRARRYLPDEPDVALLMGRVYEDWERRGEDGEPELRLAQAADTYEALRAEHPTYHPDVIAERLGLVRARLAEHTRAVSEFETALRVALPPTAPPGWATSYDERALVRLFRVSDPPYLLTSLCEQRMLAGDLTGAEADCRRALEDSDNTLHAAVTHWTLALVLSRARRHPEALREAELAIESDPLQGTRGFEAIQARHGPLALFHVPSLLIIVPAAEVHAYEALGHEALARSVTSDEQRLVYLEAARRDLRDFVRTTTDTRWREVAEERARALR